MAKSSENSEYEYDFFSSYSENFTYPIYFEDYEEEEKWLDLVNKVAEVMHNLNFIFCVVGLIINFLNCLVISHRKMWTSSINVLMIGISFCDVYIIGNTFGMQIYDILRENECWRNSTYLKCLTTFTINFLAEVIYRIYPFLGLTMAIIRVLVIYFPFNKKMSNLSKKGVGCKIAIIMVFLSSVISVWHNARYSILKDGLWVPSKRCNYPPGYTELRYVIRVGRKVIFTQMMFLKIFAYLDGSLNIIPAVLYPVVALVLVIRLLKMRKDRKNVISRRQNTKKEHTTTLVILLSITFFISQLPSGIFLWLGNLYKFNIVVRSIVFEGTNVTSILFTINATSHCIIFAVLSSQYGEVARERFRCCSGKKRGTPTGTAQNRWKSFATD